MASFPCWACKFAEYEKLYQACWIMGIIPIYEVCIARTPSYTLLPIRFYDDGSWECDEKDRFRLTSSGNCQGGKRHYGKESHVVLAEYLFAKRLWEEAARIVLKEYPDIENITFERQRSDGIFPIRFRYDPSQIAKRQEEIMRRLIDDGFCIHEELSLRCEGQPNNRREWIYEGVLDCTIDLLRRAFYDTPYGEALPFAANRSVSFGYDACKVYYETFNRELLELGNQKRRYAIDEQKQKALFEAARRGDYPSLCKLAEAGYSLNAFDQSGTTAFTWFALQQIDLEEPDKDRFKQWDHLIALGANPALFGVSAHNESLLVNAIENKDVETVRYLMDLGVNPNYFMYLDDSPGMEVTVSEKAEEWLHDWQTGWMVDGDEDERRPICEKMEEICQLLRRNAVVPE